MHKLVHTHGYTLCVHPLICAVDTGRNKMISIPRHHRKLQYTHIAIDSAWMLTTEIKWWAARRYALFHSNALPLIHMHCICTNWTDAPKERNRWTSWDFCRIIISQWKGENLIHSLAHLTNIKPFPLGINICLIFSFFPRYKIIWLQSVQICRDKKSRSWHGLSSLPLNPILNAVFFLVTEILLWLTFNYCYT